MAAVIIALQCITTVIGALGQGYVQEWPDSTMDALLSYLLCNLKSHIQCKHRNPLLMTSYLAVCFLCKVYWINIQILTVTIYTPRN